METLEQELAGSLDAGWTLPAQWYSDADIAAAERRRIFERSWQYAGRADQVAGPGDSSRRRPGTSRSSSCATRTASCADSSTSAATGGISSPRAKGAGRPSSAPTTRGRTGSTARSARRRARSASRASTRAGSRSCPLAVDTWGPFVFVNPDPDAAPLADTLGELPELVAKSGLDFVGPPLPLPLRLGDRRQLEDRARELPRVLPLRRSPIRASRR